MSSQIRGTPFEAFSVDSDDAPFFPSSVLPFLPVLKVRCLLLFFLFLFPSSSSSSFLPPGLPERPSSLIVVLFPSLSLSFCTKWQSKKKEREKKGKGKKGDTKAVYDSFPPLYFSRKKRRLSLLFFLLLLLSGREERLCLVWRKERERKREGQLGRD